ncbi:MAG TPA: geranylgeranylglycerol-phosphate geranylgeranyltransferase [archaeon]|nr:geranylgeranylglycerol-phosphate geranylgeranyltransferase [archaeon]
MKFSIKVKLKAVLELMRVKNCLIAMVAVLVGAMVVSQVVRPIPTDAINVILAMVSAFFICAGGQAVNDIFDAKIDAKLSKNKPLPSKRITRNQAVILTILFYFLGLYFSQINEITFFIALLMVVLLTLYSSVMRKVKYLGNFVVAIGTSLTFIYGASAVGVITNTIILFTIAAFFANVAREITKDFEDIKKDKGVKVTFPILLKEKAKSLTIFFYVASPLTAIAGYIFLSLNILYLAVVVIATIIFAKAYAFFVEGKYNLAQKECKIAMMMSLIAFILSIIII